MVGRIISAGDQERLVKAVGTSKGNVRFFKLPTITLHEEIEGLPNMPSKVNMRLECALFYAIGYQCRDSIHWGAVYVFTVDFWKRPIANSLQEKLPPVLYQLRIQCGAYVGRASSNTQW